MLLELFPVKYSAGRKYKGFKHVAVNTVNQPFLADWLPPTPTPLVAMNTMKYSCWLTLSLCSLFGDWWDSFMQCSWDWAPPVTVSWVSPWLFSPDHDIVSITFDWSVTPLTDVLRGAWWLLWTLCHRWTPCSLHSHPCVPYLAALLSSQNCII